MKLPPDFARWPTDALDEYEERAAIMHFDGGLPLRRAERRAEMRTRLRWAKRACDEAKRG